MLGAKLAGSMLYSNVKMKFKQFMFIASIILFKIIKLAKLYVPLAQKNSSFIIIKSLEGNEMSTSNYM